MYSNTVERGIALLAYLSAIHTLAKHVIICLFFNACVFQYSYINFTIIKVRFRFLFFILFGVAGV